MHQHAHPPSRQDRLRPGARRVLIGAAGLLLGASLAACSSGANTIEGTTANKLIVTQAAKHVVSLRLYAAYGGGFDFNGASAGAMTVRVPRGWRVEVTCINYSTTLDHSCAIVKSGTRTLAFAGAATPHPVAGLRPSRTASFSFVASKAGDYQIACLVPGHQDQGMWDHFDVRSGVTAKMTGAKV